MWKKDWGSSSKRTVWKALIGKLVWLAPRKMAIFKYKKTKGFDDKIKILPDN